MANQQRPEWGSSLMSCSPCDSCLLSTFLPCIIFGRTSQRLKSTGGEVENINGDCGLFLGVQVFTWSAWILNTMKRGEIREKYGIEGSGCGDCCTSYWCLCCALIQQEKEVKARQSYAGVDVRGYQPVSEAMHVPAPPAYPQEYPQGYPQGK